MNNQTQQQKAESSTQSGTSTINPWDPQAPFLTQGFNTASNALGRAQGAAAPSQFVSQFTPEQLDLFKQMFGYGSGNANIPASSAAAGGALTGAGSEAVSKGLFGLAGYSPTSMSGVLSDANLAANDPFVQGRIDAALRDARRSVSEQVLPQIERSAALGGNVNSSRTGIAQGLVERGLADTSADTSANIRGQAYSEGLNAALSRAMSGDTSRLGALTALTSGGNTAVGTGVGANAGAINQQGGLFDIANQGVAGQQGASQAAIDDILQRYGFATSSPFAGLSDFWNIVGGNNWGGTTTSRGTSSGTANVTTTPSTFDTIGKLMSAAGAFSPFGRR